MCAGDMLSTLLLLLTPRFGSRLFSGFVGLFVSFGSRICPQLHIHMVIFHPIQFLFILLLEERCIHVQALQLRVPVPLGRQLSTQCYSITSKSGSVSCSVMSTLCDPMDDTHQAPLSMGFFRLLSPILEWVAISSPGDLPDPGIEPGSPALRGDSLLSHQGSITKSTKRTASLREL